MRRDSKYLVIATERGDIPARMNRHVLAIAAIPLLTSACSERAGERAFMIEIGGPVATGTTVKIGLVSQRTVHINAPVGFGGGDGGRTEQVPVTGVVAHATPPDVARVDVVNDEVRLVALHAGTVSLVVSGDVDGKHSEAKTFVVVMPAVATAYRIWPGDSMLKPDDAPMLAHHLEYLATAVLLDYQGTAFTEQAHLQLPGADPAHNQRDVYADGETQLQLPAMPGTTAPLVRFVTPSFKVVWQAPQPGATPQEHLVTGRVMVLAPDGQEMPSGKLTSLGSDDVEVLTPDACMVLFDLYKRWPLRVFGKSGGKCTLRITVPSRPAKFFPPVETTVTL